MLRRDMECVRLPQVNELQRQRRMESPTVKDMDLFEHQSRARIEREAPLAARMRDNVFLGCKHSGIYML